MKNNRNFPCAYCLLREDFNAGYDKADYITDDQVDRLPLFFQILVLMNYSCAVCREILCKYWIIFVQYTLITQSRYPLSMTDGQTWLTTRPAFTIGDTHIKTLKIWIGFFKILHKGKFTIHLNTVFVDLFLYLQRDVKLISTNHPFFFVFFFFVFWIDMGLQMY